MAGPHRSAITRMLRATGLRHRPEEAPLVELLIELANQLDGGAGSRTQTAYLSALKDLRKALTPAPEVSQKGDAKAKTETEESEEPPDDLSAFKDKRRKRSA
ncbi:hypothetical protein [Lysinibacter sp. HNR]|uniref:hypothetical protein n=1 Tax=Lysinibacter sp. HNR TaxID=3031408 RepID=UPI0024349764|nr:hypothetical protein [Lysinibacter sp. HNR]WGD38485.1 hypothetical protein FrondiHNR_06130 [Lysinibacter sp. HNR]